MFKKKNRISAGCSLLTVVVNVYIFFNGNSRIFSFMYNMLVTKIILC